mmetsp:Transcript_11982/g.26135  ORF Transcript_11982/g.26135 Transcript_11982/m.26135 type:complete len:642 (+) Transcript_11982:50-1975(+)
MSATWSCKIDGRRAGIEGKSPVVRSDLDLSERTTVCNAFRARVKAHPDHVQLVTPDGTEITTAQWYELSRNVAKALLTVGMQRFDGVSIMGFNSVPWFATDLGTILAGGVVSGIYTTNNADACEYIISHSSSCAVFVDGVVNLKKILSLRAKIPYVKAVVCWNVPESDMPADAMADGYLSTFEQFVERGRSAEAALDEKLDSIMDSQHSDECCTLVYTSGTTGNPKAVMISHDNAVWTVQIMQSAAKCSIDDVLVSFLPLSHIAANMIDIKGCLILGYKVFLATPDALKGALVATLRVARPTIFLAVPRVWEKMQEKMLETGQSAPAPVRMLATWAKGVGARSMEAEDAGEGMPWGFRLANALVFHSIKAKLGLDRCKLFATSGAPMPEPTLLYFRSIYLRICDLYGASEASGPISMNRPWSFKLGTAGQALDDIDLEIMNADDQGEGEVCFRGRNAFMGYLKDEGASVGTIDDEGWVHTGDMGCIDADGFLKITGRFKELIITTGGENVAPVPIESAMLEAMPALSRVVVIGEQRKFLSMLVYPRTEQDNSNKLAGPAVEVDSEAKTVEDTKGSALWKSYVEDGMKRANKVAISSAAKVQKFTVLDEDLSVDNGLLTPTLKVKRAVVQRQLGSVIDAMYA